MRANKYAAIATQNVYKHRNQRKKTWLKDFKQALEFSANNGYYWMNIALPTHDIEQRIIKLLNRLGYNVEKHEKYLKVSWENRG